MKNIELLLVLFSIICISGGISRSVASTEKILLGVAPEDENYYKGLLLSSSSSSSSATVKCKDGSKKFNKSQFNDDFCDCPDASDEPGTSACPNGKFYCRNSGHIPLSLYSSRVNDGICDCCDGSDEYDGKIKCPNTCWEAGKVARDKLKMKIATYQEGLTLRRREIEQAKISIAKDEADLAKFKNEEKILKGLVQQLKERKEQIEKAEERELLQKEKEEKERKEAEETSQKEQHAGDKTETSEGEPEKNDNHDRIGLLEDSHSPQDVVDLHDNSENDAKHCDHVMEEESPNGGVEPVEEDFSQHASKQDDELTVDDTAGIGAGSQEVETAENTDSLSREELGRVVASRWTGEKTEQHEDVSTAEGDNHGKHEETSKDSLEEEYNRYDLEDNENSYDDDDGDDVDDDVENQMEGFKSEDLDDSSSSYKSELDDEPDLSDITSSEPSWLEKIQITVQSIFRAVNLFQTPVDKSEAERVRKEYEESSSKLSKLQSRISSLAQKLKHDFGSEKEFYSFYGQCFESKQNKYIYKICPYKQASQVEGHRTTQLGSWEKFEDSYKFMQFSNGEKCWNGPDRSLNVKLRCGLNNKVSDVDEPSRCEYVALLSTPALCQEEKLLELQDKLDNMNKEQSSSHDEL